jgi:hypothetical protein
MRFIVFLLLIGNAMANQQRAQLIEKVFNDLRATNLEILDNFYDPQLKFIDPLGEINGRPAMKQYYANVYKSVKEIRFEFTDHIYQGDTHIAVWVMYVKAGLKDGEEFVLHGNSHIKFGPSNLVVYHRDYFDMNEFIYQHIPGLNWILEKVNSRLSNH